MNSYNVMSLPTGSPTKFNYLSKYNVNFAITPKCGASTLRVWLLSIIHNFDFNSVITAKDVNNKIKECNIKGLHHEGNRLALVNPPRSGSPTIMMVRNPFERARSGYFQVIRYGGYKVEEFNNPQSFKYWLTNQLCGRYSSSNTHVRPMLHRDMFYSIPHEGFIHNLIEERIHLCRLESLQVDINKAFSINNIPPVELHDYKVKHKAMSTKHFLNITDIYNNDDELIDLVRTKYQYDFEYFGYSKEFNF